MLVCPLWWYCCLLPTLPRWECRLRRQYRYSKITLKACVPRCCCPLYVTLSPHPLSGTTGPLSCPIYSAIRLIGSVGVLCVAMPVKNSILVCYEPTVSPLPLPAPCPLRPRNINSHPSLSEHHVPVIPSPCPLTHTLRTKTRIRAPWNHQQRVVRRNPAWFADQQNPQPRGLIRGYSGRNRAPGYTGIVHNVDFG